MSGNVKNHWGKIISTVNGFDVVRHRRETLIYCECGKRIIGKIPQRGKGHIYDYCCNCWVKVPRDDIIVFLKAKGFRVSV